MAISTGGVVPSGFGLALLNFIVQRASILVRKLGGFGFRVLRNVAFFERRLPRLGVSLLWRRYQGGVDDLAAHRDIARRSQRRVELRKQRFDRLRPGQLVISAIDPNRTSLPAVSLT